MRVWSTCLARVDRNRYSVPSAFASKAVWVRITVHHVHIVGQEAVIACYNRDFGRDQLMLPGVNGTRKNLNQLIAPKFGYTIGCLPNKSNVKREPYATSYGIARLPVHRDLLSIDWNETPLSQTVMGQLASAHFMQSARHLILVGGPGTGKIHFATAWGVAAIHTTKRVRFYHAVDLVHIRSKEKKNAIKRVNSLSNWTIWMPSLLMNSVTCHCRSQAALYCFI